MALPFSDNKFNAAAMALVIFFVPNPRKGVAEMVRVVRPGGIVAAYAWDILGGGFPNEPIMAGMRAAGLSPPLPPRSGASRMEALNELWRRLDAVETREITVQRTFRDFEDCWTTSVLGTNVRPVVAAMSSGEVEQLKSCVRAGLPADAAGSITCGARANAIKGRGPN